MQNVPVLNIFLCGTVTKMFLAQKTLTTCELIILIISAILEIQIDRWDNDTDYSVFKFCHTI